MNYKLINTFALYFFFNLSTANATIITYDFSTQVTLGSGSAPYGLSLPTTITGSFTVDNTKSGNAAFDSIAIVTGSKSWDETMLHDSNTIYFNTPNYYNPPFLNSVSFDPQGILADFSFFLVDNVTPQYAYFSTTYPLATNIYQNNIGAATCSAGNCITFQASSIPEPATIVLMTIGLTGLALRRKWIPLQR